MLISLARIALILAFLAPPLLPASRPAGPPLAATLHYQSPVESALYVMPATTLAWRLDDDLDPSSLTPSLITVTGLTSGVHTGATHVALDGRTAIFKPDNTFAFGETVSVTVLPGLTTQGGAVWPGASYTFTISTVSTALSVEAVAATLAEGAAEAAPANLLPAATTGLTRTVDPLNYVTLPDDLPAYTVSGSLSGTVTDTYALGVLPWSGDSTVIPSNLLLMDSVGEPIYYQSLPTGGWQAVDFKQQPGGLLSYWSELDYRYHLLDNTYTEVGSVGAGNGYISDLHEMQLLPNGEALLMIYDSQPVDMSLLTPGGLVTATVIGLVLQSIDAASDVVFEWRSWDHFLITETTTSLTTASIDYVHGNAIELDDDGNLLVSSRHLDEITKINRDTAQVMWRWGGPRNEFVTTDPDTAFYHQHDIRRMANGDVSIFDNHNEPGQTFSRAVVYTLDEISKTATLVDDQRHTPDIVSFAMGSHGQLPDGRTLVGWGSSAAMSFSEYDPDDSVRLQVRLNTAYRSYRAARFPWVAHPYWPPTLVLTTTTALGAGFQEGGSGPALYFSWNGATEVASYEVYAVGLTTIEPLTTVPRTEFEDHVQLSDLPSAPGGTCAYRVLARDNNDQPLGWTNLVYISEPCPTPHAYLPLVFQLP